MAEYGCGDGALQMKKKLYPLLKVHPELKMWGLALVLVIVGLLVSFEYQKLFIFKAILISGAIAILLWMAYLIVQHSVETSIVQEQYAKAMKMVSSQVLPSHAEALLNSLIRNNKGTGEAKALLRAIALSYRYLSDEWIKTYTMYTTGESHFYIDVNITPNEGHVKAKVLTLKTRIKRNLKDDNAWSDPIHITLWDV